MRTGFFSGYAGDRALTDSVNSRNYWLKMKVRIKNEDGLELLTIWRQLKMNAADGRMKNWMMPGLSMNHGRKELNKI